MPAYDGEDLKRGVRVACHCAAVSLLGTPALLPFTCTSAPRAIRVYFLRRLLCGRPSTSYRAFPGVTAVGSAHWRTFIRSSVLTVCATPLLRPHPHPQSPQQPPQETLRSFRTLATAPPLLRLPSSLAPVVHVHVRSLRRQQLFISPLPPCFIHHRPSPSDARPAVSAACPVSIASRAPPASITVLIDNPTFTFAAPRHTRTVAHSIPITPSAGRPLRPTARRCIVKRRRGLLT